MKPRSLPQNRKLSALVSDVWRVYPLVPWRPTLAREAWKRVLIKRYVHEARLDAYARGDPDPFPVRPVPSSDLSSEQMSDLIEATYAVCATELDLILK